uniref:Mucin-5AC-like n=1 Tax=Panagrellus redivivus TaxID=6233 RepID=A0A7E4URN2_PANRE
MMAPGSRRRTLSIITVLCLILSVLHQIESKEVKVFKRGKVTLVDETQFENNVDYNFEQDEDDNAPADLDNLYDEKIAALPRFILHKKGEDVGLVRVPIVTRRGGHTWSTPRPKTVKGDYHTWNTDPVLPVTKAPKVTKPPKVPKKEEGLFVLPPLKSSEEKKLVVPKLNAEKPNSKSTEKPSLKSTEKSSEKSKSTEKPKSNEKSAEKSSKSTEKSKSVEKLEKAIEKLKATVKPKSSEKSKSTEKSSSAESTTTKPFSKTSPRVTPTTTKPFSKTSPHVTPTTTKKVKTTTAAPKSTSEETEGTTSVTTKKPKKTTTAKATATSKSSEVTSASKETTELPSTTAKTTKKKVTTTPKTTTTTTEATTTATRAKFTRSRFTTTTTAEPTTTTTTTTTQKPTTKTAAPFVPFAARRNFFTPESTTTTTTHKPITTTTVKPTTTTTTLKPTTTTRLAPSVFPTTIRRNFFTFISTSTQQPTTTTTRAPAPRWTPFQSVNRVPPVASPSVSPFIVNRQPATAPPPPRTLPPWARSQTFAPAVLPREEPRRTFTPQTTQQRPFTPQFQQRPFRPRFQIQAERPRPNNALKTSPKPSKTSNDSSSDQWKLTNQLSAANEALEVEVDSKERNQVNVHFVKFARRYGSQRIIPASATTPATVHIVTHFTPGPSMVQQVKSNQLFIQNQNTGSRPNNFFLPQSVTSHPRPFVNQQVVTTTITPQRFQNRVGTSWSSWSAWGSTDPRTASAFTRTRGQFVQPSATTPAPIQATTTIAFSSSHVATVTSSPVPKPPVIQHPETRYRGPTYNCRILMANEDGRPSPRNDYSCRMKYPGFPADSQCRCTYEVAGRDVHGCATGFLYTCHRI